MHCFPRKIGFVLVGSVLVLPVFLAGGCGGDDGVTPPGDTVPPEITDGPAVREITANSANVLWDTDEAGNSSVFWSVDTMGSWTEAADAQAVTDHEVAITGLNPETRYYYRVQSTDAAGNESALSDIGFFDTFSTAVTLVIEWWEAADSKNPDPRLAIRALNVTDLFGVSFDLEMSGHPVTLSGDTLSVGPFLGDDVQVLWFYDTGEDLLEIAVTQLRPAVGADGDGILAFIELGPLPGGIFDIGFREGSVLLTDPLGGSIAGFDDLVTIGFSGDGSAIPVPKTIAYRRDHE